MAWTSPRTWVDDETPTAAMFNTHIKDNYTLLKTPFSDVGKIVALSSSYLASLSATSLTGVSKTGSSNTYTGGTQNFFAADAFRVPVGTDKFGGSAGNKTAGSIWVEGNYLHHVASNQNEWRYLGDSVSTPGVSYAGCVWVDTDNLIHYVDSSGTERECPRSSGAFGHNDAAADKGSIWVETYLHFIRYSDTYELYTHNDISHTNHDDNLSHNDHDNHTDHGDYTDHDDTGGPHSNHTDHGDHTEYVASEWQHTDWGGHSNHTDHTDHDDDINWGGHDNYNDHDNYTDHGDVDADSRPVSVGT